MPFTFAHPAVVIPIKEKWKKYFDLTGLVLGSMAPDFEYFIRFKPDAIIGHTVIGFILFNLPLCFVIAFLFHKVIKKPLIHSMPSPIDRWFDYIAEKHWRINSFKGILVFIYSALIGMLSHVLWDSFTHETGRFVNIFTFLSNNVHILKYSYPVYKILQHGSTIIGSIVIIIYLVSIKDKSAKKNSNSALTKFVYFISILLSGITFVLIGMCFSLIYLSFANRGVVLVTFLNGVLCGCIIMPGIYTLKNLPK